MRQLTRATVVFNPAAAPHADYYRRIIEAAATPLAITTKYAFVRALPGNPYDGHTLAAVIDATEKLTGLPRPRRGQSAPLLRLRSETRRLRDHQARTAPPFGREAVIGHMKTDGHLGRCYLKGREGDAAANVILTAVGYNLRLFLTWLSSLLGFILLGLCRALTVTPALKWTVRGVSLKREEQLDGAARRAGYVC